MVSESQISNESPIQIPAMSSSSDQNPNFNLHIQRDGRRSNNIFGRPNYSNRRYQPKCQLCDQLGHIAKSCPQFHSQNVSINCATASNGSDKNWLLDSVASHNITGDLSNLSIHSKYDGTNEVVLSDGSGLAVSHMVLWICTLLTELLHCVILFVFQTFAKI